MVVLKIYCLLYANMYKKKSRKSRCVNSRIRITEYFYFLCYIFIEGLKCFKHEHVLVLPAEKRFM